jgi:hypothetical protein
MSETFRRFAKAFPDRVGKAGRWAIIDNYRIDVVDMGVDCRWSVVFDGRHVAAGSAPPYAPRVAWRNACDAVDHHRMMLREADS